MRPMSHQGAFAFTAVIWVVVLLVWLIEPRIHIAVPMSATVPSKIGRASCRERV